jgi:hypothetical protein
MDVVGWGNWGSVFIFFHIMAISENQRGQELIIDIFNSCGAHKEAVLSACYFSAFSPT